MRRVAEGRSRAIPWGRLRRSIHRSGEERAPDPPSANGSNLGRIACLPVRHQRIRACFPESTCALFPRNRHPRPGIRDNVSLSSSPVLRPWRIPHHAQQHRPLHKACRSAPVAIPRTSPDARNRAFLRLHGSKGVQALARHRDAGGCPPFSLSRDTRWEGARKDGQANLAIEPSSSRTSVLPGRSGKARAVSLPSRGGVFRCSDRGLVSFSVSRTPKSPPAIDRPEARARRTTAVPVASSPPSAFCRCRSLCLRAKSPGPDSGPFRQKPCHGPGRDSERPCPFPISAESRKGSPRGAERKQGRLAERTGLSGDGKPIVGREPRESGGRPGAGGESPRPEGFQPGGGDSVRLSRPPGNRFVH